jgi:hypothetical protein
VNVRVRLRARPEKSGVGGAGQRKLNPQAAEPKKDRKKEPGPEKQKHRAVPNFNENPLLEKTAKLHPKQQQVPAREPGKGHARTGNQKDAKRILRLRKVAGSSNKAVRSSA